MFPKTSAHVWAQDFHLLLLVETTGLSPFRAFLQGGVSCLLYYAHPYSFNVLKLISPVWFHSSFFSQSVGNCNIWISIVKQFLKQSAQLCLVWSLKNFPWLQPKAKSHLQFSWNTPRIPAMGVWRLSGQHLKPGRCRNQNKPQFESKSNMLAVTRSAMPLWRVFCHL